MEEHVQEVPVEVENVRDDRVAPDFESYLTNRLSPQEQEQFARDGYIVVNDVLEPDHLQALHGHIAELRAQKTAEGWGGEDEPWTMTQAVFTHAHDLGSTDAFISLLTQSKVLPKVVDILGHNIFCYHSYLVSSPPAGGRAKQPPPDFDRSPTLGFHQDSGLQRDIRASNDNSHHVMPRISLKCAYYLTDCSEAGRGNTWVVPGSMADDFVDRDQLQTGGTGQPAGAIPICCPANSCLLFDRRLWHAASPNVSDMERQVVFVGYSYRWMKARDAMFVEPALEQTSCPITRQLLGVTTQNAGLYHGNGLDIPLRQWLRNHDINDGLGFELLGPDDRGTGSRPMSALDGEVGHATFPRNPDRLAEYKVGPSEVDGLPDSRTAAQKLSQLYSDCRVDDVALDPEMYTASRLTPAERAQFDAQGYLLVEDALPPALFEHCKQTLRQMREDNIARGVCDPDDAATAAAFTQANDIQLDDAFIRAISCNPKVLPKVADIMGVNISLYHLHCNVTPPAPAGSGPPPSLHTQMTDMPCFGYHQDSGLQADCEYRPAPRFSLKTGYFLTDVSEVGMANTWIVPGKHLDPDLQRPAAGQPEGAIPICCKENTCLIFDRRLWHTASPNWSEHNMRLACFAGYGYRWLRPKEPLNTERAMARASCPVLRQMLGYTTSNGGCYSPNAEDAPLAAWLSRHAIGGVPGAEAALRPGWRSWRELQGQGHAEGDVGHTTASRPSQQLITLRKHSATASLQSLGQPKAVSNVRTLGQPRPLSERRGTPKL